MEQIRDTYVIRLLDGDNGFAQVGEIERVPVEHIGWKSVRYRGKRFALRGGFRESEFINIRNPIRPKVKNL